MFKFGSFLVEFLEFVGFRVFVLLWLGSILGLGFIRLEDRGCISRYVGWVYSGGFFLLGKSIVCSRF